jgi:isopenicillin-N epimerase
MRDLPRGSPAASQWTLDPDVVFLNHGSFGACPTPVREAQRRWQDRLERQPVRFLHRELEGHLDAARAVLGQFLGASPDDLALVPNATTGVNVILRSLAFSAGDELVVTDHGYNACRNVAEHVLARAGGRLVVAAVPLPIASPDQVVAAVLAQVTPRTRLVMVDHVTSPTGLVFPVEALCARLAERGVAVLVDGAHAPGMVPLDLAALGATYYVGNLHKWVCAPKGAAFLWARPEAQAALRPQTISHGANSPRTDRSRFRLEFDWVGTADYSPFLAVPDALRFMASLHAQGFAGVMAANQALARGARALLLGALGGAAIAPESMVGSLAAVWLPDGEGPRSPMETDPLQTRLREAYGVEVPLMLWPAPPKRLLRVSAQQYNAPAQYAYLADALRALLPH